jgi:hypothetical protein
MVRLVSMPCFGTSGRTQKFGAWKIAPDPSPSRRINPDDMICSRFFMLHVKSDVSSSSMWVFSAVLLMHACTQLHNDQQTRGESCRSCCFIALRCAISCALLRKTLRISDKTWSLSYTHKWASGFLSRAHTVEDGVTSDLHHAKVGFCLSTT